jgi:hypothetical protein
MTKDPRTQLDAYATEEALPIGIRSTREHLAPRVFAAVRALLELAERSRDLEGLVAGWEIEQTISIALTPPRRSSVADDPSE